MRKTRKNMKQTILGANGSIGIELAKELAKYTDDIRLVSRAPVKINPADSLFPADLTHKENVDKAIAGSAIVYVTIGFPYKTKVWEQCWVPFMQNVVEACREHQAKLVFFDNVYAIGGDNVNHITEQSPFSPTSRKGKIRVQVDRIILDSVEKGNINAIIARSPDFFGGTSRANSIMMNLVYDKMVKGKTAQWLCNADKIHSYGFVPDLARGTAILGNTEDAYNQIWNLPVDPGRITGREWISLFATALNREAKCSVLPGWLLSALGTVVPIMRELAEMNYQYDRDYYFDSSKFNDRFDYTPTTNEMAVRQTVKAHQQR